MVVRSAESDHAVAGTFQRHSLGCWVVYVVLGMIATVVVLATAAFLLLGHFDLGPLAASRASAALGGVVQNLLFLGYTRRAEAAGL